MEEKQVINLGSSLLVPCVQELAKEIDGIDSVPPRYILPARNDMPANSVSGGEVPVIDMQRLLSQESMDSELAKLHSACKDWGFFQLVNHETSFALLERVKKDAHNFFNLPMEEKKKFWQRPGEVEGFGQAFVVSDDQKLDWADLFFLTTQPVHARKSHLLPNLPLPFRETLETYSMEVKNLAIRMLEWMGKALKMEDEEMRDLFEDGHQSIRINYYPPCPQPDHVIGLTPHSDATGLTILLQVNDVQGLHIKKDGIWVPIKPLPNAFIVNIGDILEMITNGSYRSIEHQATVNSEKERISIATFYAPGFDREIAPARSLISEKSPPLFKKIGVEDYFRGLFSRELHGKSYLENLRWKCRLHKI